MHDDLTTRPYGYTLIAGRLSHCNKYLHFIGGYRLYQFTALPFSIATVFREFTKVPKELKLMAFAEGISIHQYIDGWLMTNSQQHCQGYTHWVVHVVERPGLDHKFLKIRFSSNSTDRVYGYNSTSNLMLYKLMSL